MATPLDQALDACPVIAIIRARDARHVPAVLRTLVEGGIQAVELTLTTPGALDALGEAAAHGPRELALGAGTVLDAEAARAAVAAGATYLITPAVLPEVIEEGRRLAVPVLPGAMTPTEILQAHRAGAHMVKVFPAREAGGPAYIRAVRAPLPDLPMVPTGGVSAGDVGDYLEAGARAVAMGSPLLGRVCEDGDLTALAARVRAVVALTKPYRRG